MSTILWLFVLLGCLVPAVSALGEIPRPEHPRPDFERPLWLNLNGEWQFEIDQNGDGEQRGLTQGRDLAQRILVPFCPESRLSGIGNRDFMRHVWYRRHFDVPSGMRGRRLLLHFGAVDWLAKVWLNGKYLGEHRGGYTPFTFDITEHARETGNELVLYAFDATTGGTQATGKQAHSRESEGCVYTRTTGIWQTVYLEAAGATYLREFALTPDPANKRVLLQCETVGPTAGVTLRLRAYAAGRLVGEERVPANGRATAAMLNLKRVTLWHPGKPFLYDLVLTIERNGAVLDEVRSYFGLRTITIEGNRFLINGKPVFQRLVLDQGFYPDGIYTAPTDADLKRDVELAMAAGFNGARLHQKVFEPRLLYWADKLGYIVWGEYPSWGLNAGDRTALAQAFEEWREVVRRDRNHPSIVGWCPLNETPAEPAWADAQLLFAATQTLDPTRPFLDTSGYVHYYPGTDVYDCHDYDQNPASFAARYAPFALTGYDPWNNFPGDPRSAYRGQPFFVSEYGGIRLRTERAPEGGWGYGETDLAGFLERYKGLTDALLDNPNMFAFCYTQLTDIEQEQNGIYFYDRTPKYDVSLVRAINERKAAYEKQGPRLLRLNWRVLLPTSEDEPQTWRYTTTRPPEDWHQPDFDDSGWKEGPGGFGRQGTPGAAVRTPWLTDDIWLRRVFQLSGARGRYVALRVHHDEDAEIWLNGTKVATLPGFTTGYVTLLELDKVKGALKTGRNVLAIRCRQTTGGQYIDAGLMEGDPAR